MASLALYRKWRSQTFDEIIGQDHVTQTLINALHMDRVAHAYLFSGPRGTGKTSTARLLAKAVNCRASDINLRPCNACDICIAVNEGRLMDLIEIDAASNTGVDDIRDLREKVGFRPSQAHIKFYIIDEVHMLSNSAFNALLKTLEEPPDHVIFVLATTEPERIPATITSRCQRFDFKRIKREEVAARLVYIVEQEGFEADPAALDIIARQGAGSMRDAISLLDQMVAYADAAITLELVQRVLGMATSEAVVSLVDALIARDIALGLDVINQVVGDGVDPRQFAREIIEYLRMVMVAKLAGTVAGFNLPDEALMAVQRQAAQVDPETIVQATSRFNEAQIDIKSGLLAIPQLPLELAFVEAATAKQRPPDGPPAPVATPAPAASKAGAGTPPPPPPPPAVDRGSESKVDKPAPTVGDTVTESGSETITMAMVQAVFDQVLDDLEAGRTRDGRRGTLIAKALRYDARLVKASGQEITFVTSDLMKGKFEQPQPKGNIVDVFSRLLGRPVNVRFLTEKQLAGSGGQTPAGSGEPQGEIEALVKMATEDLGGELNQD
jgi:DNA polymerase-3 subunit gamma/tau